MSIKKTFLNSFIAIPYWVSIQHYIKKQPICFTEVPLSEKGDKKAFIRVSELPGSLTADMVKMQFENLFSQISFIEMEGTSAIIEFSADGGERERK